MNNKSVILAAVLTTIVAGASTLAINLTVREMPPTPTMEWRYTPTPTPEICTTTTKARLIIRQSPSPSAKSLGVIALGKTVTVKLNGTVLSGSYRYVELVQGGWIAMEFYSGSKVEKYLECK